MGEHATQVQPRARVRVRDPLSPVLVGVPLLVGPYLQYTNTNYAVTNRGLYSKRGILSKDVKQIGFDKVQNISCSQSALGSSFGYGSVEISTAGGSGVELTFRSIPDRASVQELITEWIEDRRRHDPESAATADDVLEEVLRELREIRHAVTDGDGHTPDATRPARSTDDAGAERSSTGET